MANPRRGEAAVELGAKRYTLCLTLGALAELEHAFGVADLAALGERFAGGRLSARDLLTLLSRWRCAHRRGGRGAAARRRHRDARRRARRLPRRRVRERPGKPSGAAGAVSEPSPFPWDEAMAFGLGRLRWSPQEFWRATPRELAAAAQGVRGGTPVAAPSARDLAALMQAFPD